MGANSGGPPLPRRRRRTRWLWMIVNPVGSRAQEWHIDYTRGYSTIFIPISELSAENALQYAVLPAPVTISVIPTAWTCGRSHNPRTGSAFASYWRPPWSILLMDFGTIHRGARNTGAWDRNMFWISVKKRGELLPPEPVMQTVSINEPPAIIVPFQPPLAGEGTE